MMFFRLGPLALPLLALSAACTPVAAGPEAPGSQPGALAPLTKAAFSEELTERTFRYFWDTTDTEKCLAPDRWPSNPFSSIAATGFALTAYGIGAERGYGTRPAAALRTRDCMTFYWRSAERRVGNECVSPCRSRWSA